MLGRFGVVVAPLGLSVVEEQPDAFILAREGQPLIEAGSGQVEARAGARFVHRQLGRCPAIYSSVRLARWRGG